MAGEYFLQYNLPELLEYAPFNVRQAMWFLRDEGGVPIGG